MTTIQMITPCLWFDTQAEEAANFYCKLFKKSKIVRILRYIDADHEIHKKRAGSVMLVEFEINGQRFTALNGGPDFKFNEAISLEVACETQEEIDFYWNKLTEGGEEGPCGWLKDKYGLSWQIGSTTLGRMLDDPDQVKIRRVTNAFLKMKKLDLTVLEKVYSGEND